MAFFRVFLLCSAFLGITNALSCSIDLEASSASSSQPLILNNGNHAQFRLPDTNGMLTFREGERVRLVCAGMDNAFQNFHDSTKEVVAECDGGTTFQVERTKINFNQLVCKSIPKATLRRTGRYCNDNKGVDIEIGFDLGEAFLPIVNVCHDEFGYQTFYTKSIIVKEIAFKQKAVPRPAFAQGGFFNPFIEDIKMDALYSRATQITMLQKILGSLSQAKKYVEKGPSGIKYLARGHLAPFGEFLYTAQCLATFYYVNQAPQWQSVNAGNWRTLEMSVRTYASRKYQDLTVYTGVHGILQLDNTHGIPTDIYLYANGTSYRAIPVPKFFWKVVYNEESRRGTAFVTVNNPYLDRVTNDYILCPGITSQIDWVSWNPDRVSQGISYACEVDQLKQAIPSIPSLVVNGILPGL